MTIAHMNTTNSGAKQRPLDTLEMVAGLELTQNTGYDNGDGIVPQMGSLTPDVFDGRVVHRVRKDNSGLNVTIFQLNAGDIDTNFWSKIIFRGAGSWSDFEVLSSSGIFIDNNGSAAWNGLDDAGAFINTFTYQLEWFK